MTFENTATVNISAKLSGMTNKITFSGITNSNDLTPENAATQINKILAIVNKSVSATGMIKTITQEAIANG